MTYEEGFQAVKLQNLEMFFFNLEIQMMKCIQPQLKIAFPQCNTFSVAGKGCICMKI